MLVEAESYRGIDFIRISSLPTEQKGNIRHTLNHHQIIKIKRDDSLLTDCVQYTHYQLWYEEIYQAKKETVAQIELTTPALNNLAIAS